MFSRNLTLVFFIFFLISKFVYSQDKISIAVLELDAKGVSNSDASIITDRLRVELFNSNKYSVLERDKMDDVLNEQGFQLSGCTTDECAVEVGELIGVQQMVAGKIGKIGNMFTIIVRIIDVETGKVVKIATDDCSCPIEEVLTISVVKISNILTVKNYKEYKKITEEKYKDPLIAGTTGLILPIVGHAYVGGAFNILRGAIYTAGAAVLIIYGSNQNFDEGVPAILLGIGVCIISAVDAVISTNNYNKKLKSEGFSLNLIPRVNNKSISLTLAYNF